MNNLKPRSLETRCYPINLAELDRNNGIIKCFSEQSTLSLHKGRVIATDFALRDSHCRRSIKEATLLWWVMYLYFRVAGVELAAGWPSEEGQHGLPHLGHPRNELCLCYIWILKEMSAVTLCLSAQAFETLETSLKIRLFHDCVKNRLSSTQDNTVDLLMRFALYTLSLYTSLYVSIPLYIYP